MSEPWKPWATEAELVADFAKWVDAHGAGHKNRAADPWTVYAETSGWDLVLVRQSDGFQIGVEAKLALNPKVLCQVIEHDRREHGVGPDIHAVLAPEPKVQNGLVTIARRLGIAVIMGFGPNSDKYAWPRISGASFRPVLPERTMHLHYWNHDDWPERAPDRRLKLPDYVPDVTGGHPSPIALTTWKVAAIKAVIIMELRGKITRADFKALGLSASRWTQFWLRPDGEGGWLPTAELPDFKAQHPVNYEQIKADQAKWMPPPTPTQLALGVA